MIDLSAARRRRSFTGLLAVLILASTAHAQTPPPAPASSTPSTSAPAAPPTKEQLADAKKFFDAGNKLYKEGLFKEALASFLEANRIAPRASIQNNIARTYRDMKDMASAYTAYEKLLNDYGSTLKPPSLKADAQHALEELAILTGVIAITVPDAGAKVTIDGIDVGTTPIAKPIRENIGVHQVSIAKEGFEPIAQAAEIKGHDTVTIPGPLQKEILTGHISVTVVPPDSKVHVFVDGKDVGPPPWQGDLDPGSHTVEAKGDNIAATPKPIDVAKKGTYTEALEVHALAGTVAVNVDVADADIAMDGQIVGHGVWEGPAPAGAHLLEVKKPGFAPYKKDILVHDGERDVENVAMQRAQAVAPPPPPHDWKGVYSQLNLVGLFETTTPSNDVAQGVGYTTDTAINGSSVLGGGLAVRVGYSLGAVGIEGTMMGAFDHSEVQVPVNTSTVEHPGPSPRTEDWSFVRIGGLATLGARIQPESQVVRPTFGIGGGLAVNASFYNRSIEGTSSGMPGGPGIYLAPVFMMDAGILLGDTPGTRFYLGAQLVAEFSGGAQVAQSSSFNDPRYPPPSSAINVANGKDVFIGPILGMQFGE